MCTRYYDSAGGYFSGTPLSRLQDAFQGITETFNSEPHNLNPCVDLMLNFICQYYFPSCNQTTGKITPVCNRTCTFFTNNQNCSTLREIANEELELRNILSTGDSCLQTYRPLIDSPPLSENCLAIES